MHELEWFEKAAKEYSKLSGSQTILVDKALARIKTQGMKCGEALRGKLKGCRKLKQQKAGLRVVFREKAGNLQVIQIVAVGKRADSEVYSDAERRLR
jgi:mRNA interferase RelE/StbE